jgi:2-polyprenyl-6-hydroxyphenyl methylase/3-demethylubiquinone-9 3-methyltransferase
MNDLGLYERHAADWWDQHSRFAAALHGLNAVRQQELRTYCPDFRGFAVDLGCGGGLMAEPLARAGAHVVGCDISAGSLATARAHGRALPGLAYARANITQVPLATGCADLVLMADVLEHVASWREVVREASRLARPGALVYINTINRTWRARLLAIALVEGLRLVPRGTHSYRMLITPAEVATAAAACDLEVVGTSGYRPRILRTLIDWRLTLESSQTGLWGCYAMWLRKR